MRVFAVTLAVLCAPMAHAGEIALRGQSTAERLQPAAGLAVERVVQLRMSAPGLRFADRPQGQWPALAMAAGDCEVVAQDRNRDGVYETVRTTVAGRPASSCARNATPFSSAEIEAGKGLAPLAGCLLRTEADHTVVCQPTTFGRPDGEAWVVLAGFADRRGTASAGRPDDLRWQEGALLVLDGHSGAVYRVGQAPETVAQPQEAAVSAHSSPVVRLPTRSRLLDLPVSAERAKVMDDQEKTFAKYRKTPDDAAEGVKPPKD